VHVDISNVERRSVEEEVERPQGRT